MFQQSVPRQLESAGALALEANVAAGDRVNYFDHPAAAARYATHRPSGHAGVLEILRRAMGSSLPVAQALDVGCGTGQSTVALLPFAQSIIGVDSSSEMLAQAQLSPRISYRKGHAEALPVRGASFELVAVSSAYHWFDHDRFLGEAARVLKPDGWLVLYKDGTMGRMPQNAGFDLWRRERLNTKYPKVVRNDEPLTAARAAHYGFAEVLSETQFHQQSHTLADYVENLLTHSRMIWVVDGGQEPVDVARAWLTTELQPFFANGAAEMIFEARIHVLRRGAAAG